MSIGAHHTQVFEPRSSDDGVEVHSFVERYVRHIRDIRHARHMRHIRHISISIVCIAHSHTFV